MSGTVTQYLAAKEATAASLPAAQRLLHEYAASLVAAAGDGISPDALADRVLAGIEDLIEAAQEIHGEIATHCHRFHWLGANREDI